MEMVGKWIYIEEGFHSLMEQQIKHISTHKKRGWRRTRPEFSIIARNPKATQAGMKFPVDRNFPSSKLALHKGIPNDRDGLLPKNEKNSGIQAFNFGPWQLSNVLQKMFGAAPAATPQTSMDSTLRVRMEYKDQAVHGHWVLASMIPAFFWPSQARTTHGKAQL